MPFDPSRPSDRPAVLYGITPPKLGTPEARLSEIARTFADRLADLPVDGLVLYDIQDESSRTGEERPFPFLRTIAPEDWAGTWLRDVDLPKIVYSAVGKHTESTLRAFLETCRERRFLSVFVGAPSRDQVQALSLADAYRIRRESHGDVPVGGVTIPERHHAKGDEHLRLVRKSDQGCSFFVSQGVYDLTNSLDLLSDYHYHARSSGVELPPIFFTLTPCGSARTLAFMKWLGISVPHWLENELVHSPDILRASIDLAESNWREIRRFAATKGIRVGCNVESVSIRKEEIDASVELVRRVADRT